MFFSLSRNTITTNPNIKIVVFYILRIGFIMGYKRAKKSPIKNHAILFGLGRIIKLDQTKLGSTKPNIDLLIRPIVLNLSNFLVLSMVWSLKHWQLFFFFLERFNVWCPLLMIDDNLWRALLMITLYHQTKTPISFWCKRGLNPRSFIQSSEILPFELVGTYNIGSLNTLIYIYIFIYNL